LNSDPFRQVLKLKASICLVDPRKLHDPRYLGNETFIDQIALADVLVANKMDLADEASSQLFCEWAADYDPRKSVVAQMVQGRMALPWLDSPRNPRQKALFYNVPAVSAHTLEDTSGRETVALPIHESQFQAWGKIYSPRTLFNYPLLSRHLSGYSPERLKGIFNTDRG